MMRLDIESNGGKFAVISEKDRPSTRRSGIVARIYTADSDYPAGTIFFATKQELEDIRDKINEILNDTDKK